MAEDTWQPVRTGSVSDLVAERILNMIQSDLLRPGDRLPPERELSALLGVGRPALREALRALKAEGKVIIKHGIGVFVADPAVTVTLRSAISRNELDLAELYDMREVLELPAAEWAARNQDTPRLQAVQAAHDELATASATVKPDWQQLQELDAAFHLRIVEAAGNRFLASSQGVLQEILMEGMETTLRLPGRLAISRIEHKRILEAVLSGDPEAARKAALLHIASARKAAFDLIAAAPVQAPSIDDPSTM